MINDVSRLVVEAARISGRTDLPQIAPMLLGFLEGYLNNTLRTDGMVASASLTTDADGVVALRITLRPFLWNMAAMFT